MYPVHPRHQTSSLHSPVLTARHFLIGSLACLVILLVGIVTGSEPRSSTMTPLTQRSRPVASGSFAIFGAIPLVKRPPRSLSGKPGQEGSTNLHKLL